MEIKPSYIRTFFIGILVYVVGRYIVAETGNLGRWLVIGGVILFYVILWAWRKRKEE
jgi:hypothetical protein